MDRSSAAQSSGAGDSGHCNGRPWVLVDSECRIGRRRNATAAETLTSRGFAVEVSFELADPPGVSLCFVHSSGRNESHFIGVPRILSSAQAFVLLVISFTGCASHNAFHDYFVYKAGPGRPRLDLIPVPYPRYFDHKKVGVVPLTGTRNHYAVVIPYGDSCDEARASMRFNLGVFWSATKRWTAKEALLTQEPDYFKAVDLDLGANRVISLGGGMLGWVDLWWGILLCNVLDDENPTPMRLLQWPVPEPSQLFFRFDDVSLSHLSPWPYRDVAVINNGLIKFVELKHHDYTSAGQGRWTATVWSRMVSSLEWRRSSTVCTDDISVVDPALMNQIPLTLPQLFDGKAKRLTWDKVVCCSPTLSLTNDDLVHIMVAAKSQYQAYLLVVNIRNKTLEAIGAGS